MAQLLLGLPTAPGAADPMGHLLAANARYQAVAVAGSEVVGACVYVPSPGRCALILTPRLADWDDPTAARLVRTAAAMAAAGGSRLIQALTPAAGADRLAHVLQEAGLARLADLAYLRRPIEPREADALARGRFRWVRYRWLRSARFPETIRRTYGGSRDCPGLVGLRDVKDVMETHRRTGLFRPDAWHLAAEDGEPVGVVLVNTLQRRGEIVYLGVVPEARGRGVGKALVARAVRDTARLGFRHLGLACDTANEPAMRLYREAGFREVNRRMAWYVPRDALDGLAAEGRELT